MNPKDQFELEKKILLGKLRGMLKSAKEDFYNAISEKDEKLRILKLKRIDLEIKSINKQIEEVRSSKFN